MAIIKKILVGILSWESRLIVRKYKPFIVAVTGSVGKTSTKDAIYDVLKGSSNFVRKSEKSMNSEVGLPLTVIGVPNAWYSLSGWMHNIIAGLKLILGRKEYPQCLVLEVGADHPGDIRKVAKWLKPNVVVVTRVSRMPVHVEFFKTPEEVFEEKASLAMAVRKGGTLVLFGDDEKVMSIAGRVKDRNVFVVSFGFGENSTVKGSNVETVYDNGAPIGLSFNLNIEGMTNTVTLKGIIGETYAFPLLAAAAVGLARGISPFEITKSIGQYDAPKGRMNVIPGMNGSTLIDDTYNSSPDAASAALAVMRRINAVGVKYAVLGDMLELGKYSGNEHRKIGKESVGAADRLITVGQRSKATAEEAIATGMNKDHVKSFDSSQEAAEYLKMVIGGGDVVLIKGSQGIRMERVSAALLREPEKAAKLLVRQEKEWLLKP